MNEFLDYEPPCDDVPKRLFLGRYMVTADGKIFNEKGKQLSPFINTSRGNNEYLKINLMQEDGRRKGFYIHRIVATLYLGEIGDMEVDHINRNTLDNRVENLQIITPKENKDRRVFEKKRGRKKKCHA